MDTQRMGVDAARASFKAVVDRAIDGTPTVIGDAAVLSPLTGLGPDLEHALPALPRTPITQARAVFGDLVRQASAGTPQVLTRHGTPVAILIAHAAVNPISPSELVSISDALNTSGPLPVSFGLPSLDSATEGLLGAQLIVVAAAPHVGGTLLPMAAARTTAKSPGLAVLYAASGLTRAEITPRLIAGEAGVPYQRLRAGQLSSPQQALVQDAKDRLAAARLSILDRPGLSAEDIRLAAASLEGIALVIVDRLQHAAKDGIPLSGARLESEAHILARLATDLQVPVIAALDTDDSAVIRALDPALALIVSRGDQTARVDVVERDLGQLGTVTLTPDLGNARFLDPAAENGHAPSEPSAAPSTPPAPATAEPGAQQPAPTPSSRASRTPAPAIQSAASGYPDDSALVELLAKAREHCKPEDVDLLKAFALRTEERFAEAGGDLEALPKVLADHAIEDVVDLFNLSRVSARYEHTAMPPTPPFLKAKGPKEPDETWEGRHKWVNAQVLDGVRSGALAGLPVTVLDMNAAYLNAFNTWLPTGKLEHDRDGGFQKRRAGIYLAEQPEWHHPHLPNPLGHREDPGPLLLNTATVKLLINCHEKKLCDAPRISESWTSGATEYLLAKLRRSLDALRLAAYELEQPLITGYLKDMYAKFASTMGNSRYNRELYRPDWMHTVRSQAFAALWLRGYKLHEGGLTLVQMMGTDEIHVAGNRDWREIIPHGRRLSEMKDKPDESYVFDAEKALYLS
ncbi:type II toxin-antitoxin system prevent-host-death family antitoxin [Streptomyces sp. NPDC102476]|uniref:type II toxin-antitoxin system prevent-host-death family antitoxin n=1 Tax=Streptomyces sp. NPDC102476 TaxID=3366181 RepID=UPI00381AC9AE